MQSKNIRLMAAAAAVLLTVAACWAVAPSEARCTRWRSGVNARQTRQQQRLAQGLQSGQLTGREYGRLESKEGRLAAQEYRYRHDGNGLQPWEKARLEHEQNQLSRRIYGQKHDAQKIN